MAGLASALKFRGSFSLQAKGDGPVTMMLADCTDSGALRFHVRKDPERLAALLDADPAPSARAMLGGGFMAFSVDQGPDSERHQGIVSIEGDTLGAMAGHYFETSEQHACAIPARLPQHRVRLARRRPGAGADRRRGRHRARHRARQRRAGPGHDRARRHRRGSLDQTPSPWPATLGEDELLDDALPTEQLLYRLFHEQGVAADLPRALAYGCRCSRARLAGILEGFPAEDLDHMQVGGDIVMTCEFCALDFRFPRETVQGA